MNPFHVVKVLNNNVIVVADDGGKEVILIGKGIGFNRKKGSVVSTDEAEKVFVMENEKEQNTYLTLLPQVEKPLAEVTIEAIELIAKRLDLPLNEHLHVGLMDHLSFAQTRTTAGISVSNPFMAEIKVLYAKEYAIALEVIDLIKQKLAIELPKEEAGFIALHIHSASNNKDIGKVNAHSQLIATLMSIIERQLQVTIDKEGIDCMRLLRHLRFTIERVDLNEKVEVPKAMNTLLKQEYPVCYNLAWKLIKVMQQSLQKPVYDAEAVYLTLHLQRLQNKDT